jgi:predicted RNA methylase
MDIFSNLMVIGECLLDARRTKAFQRAIQKTVKSTDVVLDIGTGSSILAMTSAKAGAKHVHAIDIASDIVHFAQQNIKNNGLTKSVDVKHADAKKFFLSRPADMVTMELMDTWLVGEQQAPVLNQLRKNGVIDDHTKLIPYRYQCAATLVEYDFSFYGFTMPFVIQARNFGVMKRIIKKLSKRTIVKDIDFHTHIHTHVDERITIPVTKHGICNALVLESKTYLAPGISVWGTTDMNMPVIIPIQPKKVNKGNNQGMHMRYTMGMGFKSLEISFV